MNNRPSDPTEWGPVRFSTEPSVVSDASVLNDPDLPPVERDHCWSKLVFREASMLRSCWNTLVTLLLLYTATIFLYRLSFVEFHIPISEAEDDMGWITFDAMVNWVFWIDLFVNFLFTYQDRHGYEVDSMRKIGRNYLKTYFIVNLIACIPEELIKVIIDAVVQSPSGSTDEHTIIGKRLVRVTRLQRMSRLARLVRLTRLAKLMSLGSGNKFWKWFKSLRGVRVLNSVVGLAWCVHVLACGWYLCASLHDDVSQTWVSRRAIDTEGEILLLSQSPAVQYTHSFYFVLTVFTTVGFGDMYAVTTGEIIYVCFTMLVGAVVHGFIITEVINAVTTNDQDQEFVRKQTDLIEAFSEHTEIDGQSKRDMLRWISHSALDWASYRYDREEMKQLITGRYMPRWLVGQLPEKLFNGRLLQNKFLSVRDGMHEVPPRLPLLLALSVHRSSFDAGEVVYQMNDFPFNVFLVLDGTFAHVGWPSSEGGRDSIPKVCSSRAVLSSTKVNPWIARKLESFYGNKDRTRDLGSESTITAWSGNHMHLYPYELFSAKSFFGDIELARGTPRDATVRCESDRGSVLVLHKADFFLLSEEFPHFSSGWRYSISRRSQHRQRLLADLKRGMSYRHLAAYRIQKFLRTWYRRGRSNASIGTDKSSLSSGSSRHRDGQAESQPGVAHAAEEQMLVRGARVRFSVPKSTSTSSQGGAELKALRGTVDAMRAELRDLRRSLLDTGQTASAHVEAMI